MDARARTQTHTHEHTRERADQTFISRCAHSLSLSFIDHLQSSNRTPVLLTNREHRVCASKKRRKEKKKKKSVVSLHRRRDAWLFGLKDFFRRDGRGEERG